MRRSLFNNANVIILRRQFLLRFGQSGVGDLFEVAVEVYALALEIGSAAKVPDGTQATQTSTTIRALSIVQSDNG